MTYPYFRILARHPGAAARAALLAAVLGALCGFISACEPGSQTEELSADQALKASLEAAASKREARATLSFGFIHQLDDIPAGGPVSLELADGTRVEVQQAYLVVSAIEAHLCEPAAPAESGHNGVSPARAAPPTVLTRLADWMLAPAYAHVPSSATRLGTPFVEDLLAPGQARVIDEIAPPMAVYCSLFAVVSPADDDIVNLTDLSTDEIVGKTMLLRGRLRPGDGGTQAAQDSAWQDFESASEARDLIHIDAIDPQTGQAPLHLDSANASRMLLLDKRVSADLFDGLSHQHFMGPEAANQVLKRLEERLKIYQFQRP